MDSEKIIYKYIAMINDIRHYFWRPTYNFATIPHK